METKEVRRTGVTPLCTIYTMHLCTSMYANDMLGSVFASANRLPLNVSFLEFDLTM